MAMRPGYLVRETATNLFRNPMLTAATVLTTTVSLAMLGLFSLMGSATSNAFNRWEEGVEFIVYMTPGAGADSVEAVRTELENSDQVLDFEYANQDRAYDEFQRMFDGEDELLSTIRPTDLPTWFQVKPTDSDADFVQVLAGPFGAMEGVMKVVDASEELKKIQDFVYFIRRVAGVGMLLLGVATLLLISNSIQTAVYARRDEIEVMRLVGASNWFVRTPFVFEGTVQGLMGATIAALGVFGLAAQYDQTIDRLFPTGLFSSFVWTAQQRNLTVALLAVVGPLLGSIVSAVAVTFYLRE